MMYASPPSWGAFFKVLEWEDVLEVKKKGLPRSFQSLAMAGMPVSLRGIFLFCHSRENGNPERSKLDSCSRIPSKKPTGRNDKWLLPSFCA